MVRPTTEFGYYEIVAGGRRYRVLTQLPGGKYSRGRASAGTRRSSRSLQAARRCRPSDGYPSGRAIVAQARGLSRASVTIRRSSRGKALKVGTNRTVLRELTQRALARQGQRSGLARNPGRPSCRRQGAGRLASVASTQRSFGGAFSGMACAASQLAGCWGPQVVA